MRGAVIDLGTNTFNLIVFEKEKDRPEHSVLTSYKNVVNLGLGGINENKINRAAISRALNALRDFSTTCEKHHVEKIVAFGTSALRGAKNASILINRVKKELNIEIVAIDGDREATLIYEGVKRVHSFDNPSCIMDIGGGSTEFIIIEKGEVVEKRSFNIGVSRIIQKFELSDPMTSEDISTVISFLENETGNFFSFFQSNDLIGASGSFETFFDLVTYKKNLEHPKSSQIPFEGLLEQLNYLISSSLQERRENVLIPNFRQTMIHVAALKTRWVIEQLGLKQCFISPASLKEGVIYTNF